MEQITMGEATPEYQAFVDKFKPKLTTDDCYTQPGGDYQREEYPPGCVVVDNPPFSIMAEIVPWYCQRGIRFLLFNQHTTGIKAYAIANRCTVLATSCAVTYANGAMVNTGFLTNLENKYIIRSAPDLHKAVEAANKENLKSMRHPMPKYVYPWHIVTCAMVGKYSKYGIAYGVPYGEGERISALDSQRKAEKQIFGGGLLVSERLAKERELEALRAEKAKAAASSGNETAIAEFKAHFAVFKDCLSKLGTAMAGMSGEVKERYKAAMAQALEIAGRNL